MPFDRESFGGGNFVTHFQHNRAPAQIQPSLTEVYEAEISRLREENHYLRIQHNSIVAQLNEALAQLQQANAERTPLLKQRTAETENVFYNTKKDFWQLTRAARNNKKTRVRQLVAQSVKALEEITSCLNGQEIKLCSISYS